MAGISLRGWHIVCAGIIWLISAILTFLNFLSTIMLGVVFIVLALVTISIGMLKIVKFERYERAKSTVPTTQTERPLQNLNGGHPYSTFSNEAEVTVPVEIQEELDPNDPNIRFSKKYQNQLKYSN